MSGLEIDHRFEHGCLLDRQSAGLRTFQNLVHILGGAPIDGRHVGTIAHHSAGVDEFSLAANRRKALVIGRFKQPRAITKESGDMPTSKISGRPPVTALSAPR